MNLLDVLTALLVVAIIATTSLNGDVSMLSSTGNAKLFESAALVGHGALDEEVALIRSGTGKSANEFQSENLWVRVSSEKDSDNLWVVTAAVYEKDTDVQPLLVFQTLQAAKS